jgi:hypothetical protein
VSWSVLLQPNAHAPATAQYHALRIDGSTNARLSVVTVGRKNGSDKIGLADDMLRPCWFFSKPDAILRHVASWGDRFPMA